MRTLCRFSGRGEMPEGKEVGRTTEKGHRRARARLTAVLSALAVLLLVIFIIAPGAGQAASPGGNGKSASGIDRDGRGEAYVTIAGGGRQMNSRNKSVGDIEHGGSANGAELAFSNSPTSIGDDIFVMNADGTGQGNLTDDPDPDNAPDSQPLPEDDVDEDDGENDDNGVEDEDSDGEDEDVGDEEDDDGDDENDEDDDEDGADDDDENDDEDGDDDDEEEDD